MYKIYILSLLIFYYYVLILNILNQKLNQYIFFFKIHNFFFSKEFNNFFFKKLFLRILKSRFKDINYFLRLLKIKNFNNFKNKYFFSNLETKIEYSFLRNNAAINPHTDSIKKLLFIFLKRFLFSFIIIVLFSFRLIKTC